MAMKKYENPQQAHERRLAQAARDKKRKQLHDASVAKTKHNQEVRRAEKVTMARIPRKATERSILDIKKPATYREQLQGASTKDIHSYESTSDLSPTRPGSQAKPGDLMRQDATKGVKHLIPKEVTLDMGRANKFEWAKAMKKVKPVFTRMKRHGLLGLPAALITAYQGDD